MFMLFDLLNLAVRPVNDLGIIFPGMLGSWLFVDSGSDEIQLAVGHKPRLQLFQFALIHRGLGENDAIYRTNFPLRGRQKPLHIIKIDFIRFFLVELEIRVPIWKLISHTVTTNGLAELRRSY